DIEYQQAVDEIVLNNLKTARSRGNSYLEDALAVVMNPQTGEVLALSGWHYNRAENRYENTPHKVIHDSHLAGSTVKGATVLAGYQSGVISPGTTMYDRRISIQGTPTIGSWMNLGSVND